MSVFELFSEQDESNRRTKGEQLSDIGDFGGITVGMRGLHAANQAGSAHPVNPSTGIALDPNATVPGNLDWDPSGPPSPPRSV